MIADARNVVLDTHAWIWWVNEPAKLSAAASTALAAAQTVGVSAISCWEVAMLAVRGRIAFDREPRTWVRQALAQPGVLAIPVSPPVATDAALLDAEDFPSDPADRIIYATARSTGSALITRDAAIRGYDPTGTLW